MELLENGIGAGHKILLFSQFTSMLDIIAKRLNKEKIPYYMLTGSTPKKERMQLVSSFHKDQVMIFLISLKAGAYPYLTPLFINYESMELAEDGRSGKAVFSQAARLPGMVYELPFVYEDGRYKVIAFEDFPDGSYLEKFDMKKMILIK